MAGLLPGLLPYLRLLRAGTLFSPGCDVVAGLCILGAPWSLDAVRIALASICLYAAGMVWNDVADRRLDAVQRPERPIPSGDVPLAAAAVLGALLVGAGVVLSPPAFRWHHMLLALLVLVYDFLSKRNAWAGALNMGALRGLNLATAAAPLWLHGGLAQVPGPLLTAASCYAVYIVAVTILGLYEDQASVSPRAVVTIQAAPLLAGLYGLIEVQGGLWPAPVLAAVPVVAFARRNRLVERWDQAAIRRSMTWLLLGTMLYTALLCAASECWVEAAGIAACIPVARRIARSISLT